MITADVCARKRSCVRLVNAGPEPSRRQNEIDLTVYLPDSLKHVRSLFWTVCVVAACLPG
ncbi:hypothetical protein DPMN_159003 [Dreissena polymorpha]|uniref:Uncharacterized protein n=1 Tax=Dreissena polymorpha TaxID=45954 RepID=A0A9D4IQC3_DREPO|nr:hypothetical protein DPMN_158491 [Dreissena polymorpha]KAH3781177.1 hypothetical protein DPMN_159003 [Dreissena polymorpha]